MKCQECQRISLENGGRDLPAECLEHLVGCAECRKANERTVIISRLLALKKHEQPDPLFEIRNAAAIRKRISEEKPSALEWLQELLEGKGWRIALAGTVAACLAIVATQFARPPAQNGTNMPAVAHREIALPAPAAPQSVIIPQPHPDPNDPAWLKPMYVIETPGIMPVHRGDVRFGDSNKESRLVDWTPGQKRAQE